MVQTLQKTVEFPQVQLVDFLPGRRHHCRGAETDSHGPVQKTIEIRCRCLCRSSFRVQAWRRQPSSRIAVVELWTRSLTRPLCATTSARGAVQQGCGRPCDHAGGSAPYSVHRRCGGHSSSQQRQVSALGGYGGDERVVGVGGAISAVLTPFFALLQLSRSGAPVFGALDGEEFFAIEGSPCQLDCGDVDIHAFIAVSEQQQQQPTTAGRFDVPVGLSSQPVPYPCGEAGR